MGLKDMFRLQEIREKKGTKKFIKIISITCAVLTVIFAALSVLIYRSINWMLNTWSNLSMEELVFHLKAPLEGTNSSMIINYITYCVILTVFVAVLLAVAFVWLRKKRNAYYITMAVTFVCSLTLGFFSVRHAWDTLDVAAYTNNQSTYSTFIDDNYVDPSTVNLAFPEQKRNLIYIFLESMENTYADKGSGGAFEDNVIPELTQLSLDNENFSGTEKSLNGGYSMTGSTWTIAAMFSQTSGIPLSIPIDKNGMDTQDTFFPGVTSIGDILEKEGYQQALLLGSDAVFGGRQLYFQQHGNYKMYDYNYSLEEGEIPEGYHVWWGYEDKRLFENGKKRLNELAASDQPFNFTMLTVDTHFEDGYVCPDCPKTFDDQYSNVMACSSHQVAEFVEWIQQQPFYENTTIVISGDHPTMDKDFCEDIDEDYTRKVYTTYINAPAQPEKSTYREYSTFDNFPTTLASLGVEIDGNRLGLGTNLFSYRDTLTEVYGRDVVNNELSKKSQLMDSLTEDIINVEADISLNRFDTDTDSFQVVVRNVRWNQEVSSILGGVWTREDQKDLKWYESEPQEDGSYIITVPIADYDYKEGTYIIHVYATNVTGTRLYIDGISQTVGAGSYSKEEPEAQNVTADVVVEPYNYKLGKYEVKINNIASDADVQSIRCAVWSEEDQSDMKWYEAKKTSDGTYVASVWARDFQYKETTYNVHVYAIDGEGQTNIICETEGIVD